MTAEQQQAEKLRTNMKKDVAVMLLEVKWQALHELQRRLNTHDFENFYKMTAQNTLF